MPPDPFTSVPDAGWERMSPSERAIRVRMTRVMPALLRSVGPDAPFSAGGGDSIDFVELLCAVETDYGVRFSVDDITPLRSMGELVREIDRKATKRPAP